MQLPYKGRCKITTLFGKKGSWACGWHIGLDLVGLTDKNIHAIADGTVTGINIHGSSYGNSVEIRHEDERISFYAHLRSVKVKRGQGVKAGDILGLEGATGNASGSHLHLEIHQGAYKYPAKGTSPGLCPWLIDPCEVLGVEKKLGEAKEVEQANKVKIRTIPDNKRYSVDGFMVDNKNYAGLREALEPLPFVEKVGWDGATKEVLIYLKK